VTARDKAIESMVDATDYDLRYRLGASGTFDLLGAMLDLIPTGLLRRLADERDEANRCGVFVPAFPGLSNGFYCQRPKPCDIHQETDQ